MPTPNTGYGIGPDLAFTFQLWALLCKVGIPLRSRWVGKDTHRLEDRHGQQVEVYRARDNRLNREVAIKGLPAVLPKDGDRLRRFEQETSAERL